MYMFGLLIILIPFLNGLPVRVSSDHDYDDWDDDLSGDFEEPTFDDPTQSVRKLATKKENTEDLWKINMNRTKKGKHEHFVFVYVLLENLIIYISLC